MQYLIDVNYSVLNVLRLFLLYVYRDFPRDAPRAIGALELELAPWSEHWGARGRPVISADVP